LSRCRPIRGSRLKPAAHPGLRVAPKGKVPWFAASTSSGFSPRLHLWLARNRHLPGGGRRWRPRRTSLAGNTIRSRSAPDRRLKRHHRFSLRRSSSATTQTMCNVCIPGEQRDGAAARWIFAGGLLPLSALRSLVLGRLRRRFIPFFQRPSSPSSPRPQRRLR
jgi:hypothetical protein